MGSQCPAHCWPADTLLPVLTALHSPLKLWFISLHSSDLLSSPSPQPCHCHWLSWRAPHRAEQEASLQVELSDATTLPLGIRQPFPRQVHQHFADITNTRSSSFGLLPLLYAHWLGSGQAPANPSGPRSRGSAGTGVQ